MVVNPYIALLPTKPDFRCTVISLSGEETIAVQFDKFKVLAAINYRQTEFCLSLLSPEGTF